ncbi:alpha/beta fold hydrolase [Luteibacter aegosomatissinici]|uniref:alpha/beta fold hydrolase n=1 Tax=Luteibacter aegosomatissinici TaxID=2911539 RepID=UPI001FFA09AA|nr:alpha/beta hydrolase [Luteibacter aegosomatissinici]UPG92736.1 alpha/beta hydrolase [Luteibacter aegosomatissinici]
MKRLSIVAALALTLAPPVFAGHPTVPAQAVSDTALVRALPGFASKMATVNGVRLHYVIGGRGPLVILLPGWPETWWSYHKTMPELAKTHRVISVDLRGMGASDKPAGGFDKKTMANDIAALITQVGDGNADVVGHDIGAMVAFSLAANHPELVRKLVLLDVGHPSKGYLQLKMLPDAGTFNDKIDEDHPYLWWFAFHQVKGLPEDLMEGREDREQAWFFRYMTKNEAAIDARDRAVYAAAYASRDAIRASNGWYQTFNQDIADSETYGKLPMPVLGLGGPGYARLKAFLEATAAMSTTYRVEGSGHFIAEEKPDALLTYLTEFLNQ